MLVHQHYESLPLLWLAFLGFLLVRVRSVRVDSRWRLILAAVCLGIDAILLFVAVNIFSPWLAYLGLIFGSASLLILSEEKLTRRDLVPLLLLLIVGLRLPLNLDRFLISDLQLRTSSISSEMLNELGCLHYRAGNTLEVNGVNLFVEEACSGVQSLFTLTVFAALIVVFFRRHWLHGLCLFLSAWLWSGLMNTTRVTSVALAQDWYDFDLATGVPHDILGYACLLTAILLLLSTDQFLYFLFGPVVNTWGNKTILPKSPVSRFWNDLFLWKSRLGMRVDKKLSRAPLAQRQLTVSLFLVLISLSGLVVAGTTQFSLQNNNNPGAWKQAEVEEEQIKDFPKEALPAEIENWRLVSYRSEVRDRESIWARYSAFWIYTDGSHEVEISINNPYAGWKDLRECYRGIGWDIVSEQVHTDPKDRSWFEIAIANQYGRHQFITYAMFALNGEVIPPKVGLALQMKHFQTRLDKAFSGAQSNMLQVRIPSETTLTEETKESIRKLAEGAATEFQAVLASGTQGAGQ